MKKRSNSYNSKNFDNQIEEKNWNRTKKYQNEGEKNAKFLQYENFCNSNSKKK